MSLGSLMLKYGSDKGGDSNSNHNYTTIYDPLLSCLKSKGSDVNLFELGLGTINTNIKSNMGWVPDYKPGASQRAWSEWLPDAHIYGADIDSDTLFTEGNIRTFQVDQTDAGSIDKLWTDIGDVLFDVIIDDGLHEFDAGFTFMLNSIHKLKPGGLYIVEDITHSDCEKWYGSFDVLKSKFTSVEIVKLLHYPRNLFDNNLLICRI
jgi:hypothetical protein